MVLGDVVVKVVTAESVVVCPISHSSERESHIKWKKSLLCSEHSEFAKCAFLIFNFHFSMMILRPRDGTNSITELVFAYTSDLMNKRPTKAIYINGGASKRSK